jgi:hypothetical protein
MSLREIHSVFNNFHNTEFHGVDFTEGKIKTVISCLFRITNLK